MEARYDDPIWGRCTVRTVTHLRYLGVYINHSLKWEKHVSIITNRTHSTLHVTGSSCQAHINKYFTRRSTVGVNRDNAHRECTHCGGVYHSPTQCSVIIAQTFNYVPYVKATPIPISPKPKEGTPTSSRYSEYAIKPLPQRAREPRP